MRFILLAAALAASLVSAASAPRAAGAPVVLRQATRKQVIRQLTNKRMRKRQSLPSGGVYPTCDGSPATGSRVFSVIDNVELVINTEDTNRINILNTESALDCTEVCTNTSGCFASQWTLTASPAEDQNCELYDNYGGANNNDFATSTYFGYDCTAIQAEFEVGDLTCCNYYANAPA